MTFLEGKQGKMQKDIYTIKDHNALCAAEARWRNLLFLAAKEHSRITAFKLGYKDLTDFLNFMRATTPCNTPVPFALINEDTLGAAMRAKMITWHGILVLLREEGNHGRNTNA